MADTHTNTERPLANDAAGRLEVLDAVRDIVLIVDGDGCIADANSAAELAYGYSRDELRALSVRDLRVPALVGDIDGQMRLARDAGITFETVHRRKDGSQFPVEVSSSAISWQGFSGLVSIVRDVSARKREEARRAALVEQLAEANERLDGALTLLASVVGAVDLEALLGDTVTALVQVMDADAALFVVRESGGLRVRAIRGLEEWAPVGTLFARGEAFCGRVAEAGVPVYVSDVTASSAAVEIHTGSGVQAMFGVPVYVGGELFGVLECAWLDSRKVDEAQSGMVQLAAERIALAIQSARSLERSKRTEQLSSALNEVNARLNASLEMDASLDGVLATAAEVLGCDVALLGRAALGEWHVEHSYGVEDFAQGLVFDQLILGALSSDAPVTLASADSPHAGWLGERLGLSEAMVVAIPSRRGAGGALLFGRRGSARGFDDLERDFVSRVAQTLALSLSNAAQFEAEHHIAETLQEALLLMPPAVRGIEFAHLYRSATMTTRVGGDFFDVFEMADDRVGVIVGDVSGKGLEAAVLTSIIKDTIRAYAHDTPSPAAAIARANVALHAAAKLPDFASVLFAVVDCRTGRMTYCNAGHPPALVVSSGDVGQLEGTSPVIGAFPDLSYADREVALQPDQVVLLYTDGVTEARDAHGGFFGDEGLANALEKMGPVDVSDLPHAVLDAVTTFTEGRLTDDIALLAFRRT